MDILQAKGYNIVSQVYQVATCQVFKATHPGCAQCYGQIAIKVQRFNNQTLLELSWREVQNMNSLQDLQQVVRLNEYFYEPLSDGTYVLVIVMEWIEKDLMKDMQQRKSRNYPWPEQELIALATDLIATLAEAERRGIAHRDIKPQNIFLDTVSKNVKIGDFGSSKANIMFDPNGPSLVGTPALMSEELKEAMMNGESRVSHDVGKSDVFALGVTLLILSKLEFPNWLLQPVFDIERFNQDLAALLYSFKLKTLIWEMMDPIVDRRLSFQELEAKYCLPKLADLQPDCLAIPHEYEDSSQKVVEQQGRIEEEPEVAEQEKPVQHCCFCQSELDKGSPAIQTLFCACGINSFCGKDCVVNYVENKTKGYVKSTVECHYCGACIEEKQIIEVYGGIIEYKKATSKLIKNGFACVSCKINRATHIIECGHVYCQSCLNVYRNSEDNELSIICSLCGLISSNTEEIFERGWFQCGKAPEDVIWEEFGS